MRSLFSLMLSLNLLFAFNMPVTAMISSSSDEEETQKQPRVSKKLSPKASATRASHKAKKSKEKPNTKLLVQSRKRKHSDDSTQASQANKKTNKPILPKERSTTEKKTNEKNAALVSQSENRENNSEKLPPQAVKKQKTSHEAANTSKPKPILTNQAKERPSSITLQSLGAFDKAQRREDQDELSYTSQSFALVATTSHETSNTSQTAPQPKKRPRLKISPISRVAKAQRHGDKAELPHTSQSSACSLTPPLAGDNSIVISEQKKTENPRSLKASQSSKAEEKNAEKPVLSSSNNSELVRAPSEGIAHTSSLPSQHFDPASHSQMNGIREHCFGLRKDSKRINTCAESRASHQTLSFGEESFKAWHDKQIESLQQLTPQVRKTLTWPGKSQAQTNLLKYKIDLFVNGSKRIEIENRDDVWVSGWGSAYAENKLKQNHRAYNFKFISSQIPDFDILNEEKRQYYLNTTISNGFCLEKHSFLIQERLQHQKESLEKARKEVSHLNTKYLHTEQGLMLYLDSKEFRNLFLNKVKTLKLSEQGRELALVVNLVSSRGVCMNCADRMFRESEWAQSLEPIRDELTSYNIKIHFLASAYEPYPDILGGGNLLQYYKNCSDEEKQKLGFNRGNSQIEFLKNVSERQQYKETSPFIGHATYSQ